jgi:hypothetical protein
MPGQMPSDPDNSHLPENFPRAQIILDPSDSVPSGSRVNARIEVQSTFPVEQVDIFLNDEFRGSYRSQPYEFRIRVEGDPGDEIKLTATVYDQARNKTTVERIIRINND